MKETITHKMVNRLHRRNSSASSTASVDFTSGERFEFKFSALHALQVPKGWDKLSLSLISVETGKAIAKTGRSLVQNGNCQWTENLSVYIWVPHDDASKGHGQSLHKLLISMGSGRSGILGEVTVNLSSHLSSETSTTVAEPLKNCSYGTILQMEIRCLTPRANMRNDRWTDTDSFVEDANASDDLDTTSDVSDGRTTKSVESSMSSNFMYTSQAGGPGSKDASVSARGSLSSIDSMDDSFGRNIIEVANDLIARHDSISSSNRAQYSSYHVSESPRLSQKQDSGKFSHSIPASPLRTFGSPEFVLEGEGATAEELRAEARMWERNARRLKVDLDFSKKEFKDQTRKLQNASMEIIALQTECDGLKHENDYLKAILDESEVKEKAAESLKLQTQDDIQSELEEEIKFQRDLNNNLSLQFNKTQESNLELVSVLQELEETIEKQRMEIESLNALKDKIKELERDCNDLTNENLELVFKLKESKNDLATSVDSTAVSEITKLECEIQKLKEEANKRELDRIDVGNLQNRCNDLESKCVKLEVDIQGFKDKAYYLDGELNKYRAKAEEHENEVVRLKELLKLQEEDKHETVYSFTAIETKPTIKDHFSVENEMEFSLKDDTGILEKPNMQLSAKSSEIEVLKSDCLLKDQEIQRLNAYQTDLEIQLSDLKIIKKQLMGGLKAMQTESTIISECLDKVKNDMVVLNDTKDSQVAANKTLEKKLRELESCNKELEQQVTELEVENLHLSERISGLEPQLRYLTDARESNCLEIQHSETRVMNLQAEIKQLEAELETSKVDMRQKLEDMQKRWLEAQEECEYLKKANPKLQTTAENLIEECSQLQVSNRELKQQRLDLHNRCTDLEAERRESQYNFSKLSTKLEDLEDKFSLMMNKIAAKEKIFDSELEALHLKIEGRMEKLVIGEDITDDKIIKTIEVEYEENIHDLMVELVAYKQNNAVLEVKLEKLTELLEKTRSNEENLRIKVGGLEGDLKHCEYQRVQLTEEISSLTGQLQKIPLLQDELVALKKSYNDVKYENERLEASLQLVTGDYKELKEEKTSLLQRTLSMQKAMIELEEYKLSKAALEEQVIRLRGDLTAREALCAQDTELKNEIGRLKRSNSQLRWKINSLQEEKDECLKNAQVLEEKLEQIEYSTNNSVKSFRSDSNISFHEHMKLTEDVDANIDEVTIDASSRIRSLENELAEALQANDMYKAKINSFLSKEQIHESDVPLKLDIDVNTVKKEHDKDASLLETELKELRERYLHMSLKYAEVEAQREELVLKLKAVKPGKSWFS
ncbi:putative transcription factor bZIP family [Helianthus debilis subsp. tardiflorus]